MLCLASVDGVFLFLFSFPPAGDFLFFFAV